MKRYYVEIKAAYVVEAKSSQQAELLAQVRLGSGQETPGVKPLGAKTQSVWEDDNED